MNDVQAAYLAYQSVTITVWLNLYAGVLWTGIAGFVAWTAWKIFICKEKE